MWKAWAFVVLTTAFILWFAWTLAKRDGLLWAVPVVLSINYFLLIHSRWRIVAEAAERPLEGNDGWRLMKALNNLCEKAGVTVPQVRVIDVATPQAFLLGRLASLSTLYVTQGFLDQLDPLEREAILAFEVATLKSRLQFNFSVVGAFFAAVLWAVAGFDHIASWVLGTKRRRSGSMTIWLAWPFLYLVQRWSLSPADYFRLDQMAAEMCSDKDALCQALWKLESSSLTQPLPANPAWTHVFAVAPWETRGPIGHLQPQPPAKQRIHNLNGGFPI